MTRGRRHVLLVAATGTAALVVAWAAETARAEGELAGEAPISDSDRDHWSFRPVAAMAPPAVADTAWPVNPIDRFILARLEAEGLRPAPAADRTTLVRRITFDLTGLPPTGPEIEAFLADDGPEAWQRVVDRLLASPAYGERFAQHWLDLARFAETDGFEHDHARPHAHRYRDWVIEAANRDLPYDEFLQLQLAADELVPGDAAALEATGFLLAGPDMPDINSQDERRHTLLNEITATVASVVLGLQFGCAQCHDHKFDPVSQGDFYRLRAFFDPADVTRADPNGRVIHEAADAVPASFLYVRGDFRRPGDAVFPAFPRVVHPADLPAAPAEVAGRSSGRRAVLARWLTAAENPLTGRVIVNRLWQQHFGQGLSRTPSDVGVMGDYPSHPELLDWLAAELATQGWSLKAMHRLMVTSATYRQASRLADAERVDEAASSQQHAWRLALERDPANRLLARMPRRRLDGEAIRDAMLAAADRLSPRRGGEGVRPPLPAEMLATLLKDQWVVSPDEEDHRRRSIYLFVRRNLRYPLLEVFDAPDRSAACGRRNQTTTPTQALWLLNSEFALARARDLAGLAGRGAPDHPTLQAEIVFRRALGRPPSADEAAGAAGFLASQAASLAADGRATDALALPEPVPAGMDPFEAAALVDLCRAAFSLNEFVYVD
jgi:hypothetical protein